MFNNNGKETKNSLIIETLIGENCTIVGNISGEGLIKIDGSIQGDINWVDDIIIGDKCTSTGNIVCKNANIHGNIYGNVMCEETLILEQSGKIFGDITVKKLIIKEGGFLEGKCTMIVEKSLSVILD